MLKLKLLSILIIIGYIGLLIPNMALDNVGMSGTVIASTEVPLQSFQKDIQDILPPHNSEYYVIVIKDIKEGKKYAVISSSFLDDKDGFVKIKDISTEWYIDSRIFSSIINQHFDKLIIGNTNKVEYVGWIVDTIISYGLSPLFTLSSVVFFVGGFLVIMIISLLLTKTVHLWNIPAMLCCYSFQFLLGSIIAIMNQAESGIISIMFGSFFIVFLPLTFIVQRYEETAEGKQKIKEVYEMHMNLLERFFFKYIRSML